MNDRITMVEGIYALLQHLNIDSSKGVEKSIYEERLYKGRLSHFSVSQRQDLAEDIISAIIKIGHSSEDERKRRRSYIMLRQRRKRIASRGG